MPLPAFDTPLIFETGQEGRANRYLPSGPALDTGERRCLLGLMKKMLRSRGGR